MKVQKKSQIKAQKKAQVKALKKAQTDIEADKIQAQVKVQKKAQVKALKKAQADTEANEMQEQVKAQKKAQVKAQKKAQVKALKQQVAGPSPATNGATAQELSQQWMQHYQSQGMHAEADKLEAKIKAQKKTRRRR